MALTQLAVFLLLVAIAIKPLGVDGETSLLTCLTAQLSSKVSCLGMCILNNGISLQDIECQKEGTKVYKDIEQKVKYALATNGESWDSVYNVLIKDRTDVCKILEPAFKCAKESKEYLKCGSIYTDMVQEDEDLIRNQRLLDCDNPKSENLLYCLASPKIVHEFQSQGWNQRCASIVLKHELFAKINSSNLLAVIMTTLDDPKEKVKLCTLYDEVTKCIRDTYQILVKCSSSTLLDLDKELNTVKDLIGCGVKQDYYDGVRCGLKLTVPGNLAGFGPCVAGLGPLSSAFSQNPTIFKLDSTMCPIETFVSCIGAVLKSLCGSKWTYGLWTDLTKPVIDFLIVETGCTSSSHPKPTAIADCKCLASDYKFGGQPSVSTCTTSDAKEKCVSSAESYTSNLVMLAVILTTLVVFLH